MIGDLLKVIVQRTRRTNEKQNVNYRHSTLHSVLMRKAGWPCCNAQNVLYKWRSPLGALQSQTCWIFLAKKTTECGGFRQEPANCTTEAFLSSWLESRVSETLLECSWSDLKVGPQTTSVSRDFKHLRLLNCHYFEYFMDFALFICCPKKTSARKHVT